MECFGFGLPPFFDYKTWKETPKEDRETEVAEWRSKKNAAGKYNVDDCKVLEFNDSKSKLLMSLKNLEEDEEEKGDSTPKESAPESEDEMGDDSKKERSSKKLGSKVENSKQLDAAAMGLLQSENEKLRNLLVKKSLEKSADDGENPPSAKKAKAAPLRVPIVKGSNYMVDAVRYEAAKSCKQAYRFVGDMLLQLFEPDVLVVSNILGGKAKVGIKTPETRRWALHNKRRLALFSATNKLFGLTEPQVNRAIMYKINNLRDYYKANNKLDALENRGREELSRKRQSHAACDAKSSDDEDPV